VRSGSQQEVPYLVGYRMGHDLRLSDDTPFRVLLNARVIDRGIDPSVSKRNTERSFRQISWHFNIDPDREAI
jgi:hypothetical protein